MTTPDPAPDERPVLDVIAEAIHRAECGCTDWHPKDPEDDTYDRYAAAVLAACQGATVAQRAELVGDRYRPGRHDRITRDDALPPSGPPPKGTLDEVVLTNVDVHLERMTNDCYWLGLTKGGRDDSLRVALGIGLRPGRKRAVDAWISDESGSDLHLIPERTDEDRS